MFWNRTSARVVLTSWTYNAATGVYTAAVNINVGAVDYYDGAYVAGATGGLTFRLKGEYTALVGAPVLTGKGAASHTAS